MVSEWHAEYLPLNGWWVSKRYDFHKDGTVNSYINDILDNEAAAIKSADDSRKRHLLWDHYEALKMHNQ